MPKKASHKITSTIGTEQSHHAHHCSCGSMGAFWVGLAVIFIVALVTMILTFNNNAILKKELVGNTVTDQNPPSTDQPTDGGTAPVQVSVENDAILGSENAKVTVIEFSDYECPFCGASEGTHQGLIDRFKGQDPTWEAAVPKLMELAKQGKIKFVYRDFPLSIHAQAQKAAEASECAHEQGKFWEYHDLLFQRQDQLSVANFKVWAGELGLNQAKFDDCLDSGKMAAEVQKDFNDGRAVGVQGTPAFFINGQLISGAQPWSAFEPIINAALNS
ncbi:MAG: DsbA family protein [Candidatus Woesearchaeota archaeon]